MLCVDEDSGLVGDWPAGEAFFGEDGEAAPALRDILNFLTSLEQNRAVTQVACGPCASTR